MKYNITKALLLLVPSCAIIFFTNCSSHSSSSGKSAKDTTYIIYNKDSTKSEVKITDGDTVIEDMAESGLLPIKR